MEKIYCHGIYNPSNKESTDFLVELYYESKKAKEHLDKDNYRTWIFDRNNYLRGKLNLPNNIFAIAKSNDDTQACIMIFPKEPDGNNYYAEYDVELDNFYILVDHIKE